jgi:hypothetical protein
VRKGGPLPMIWQEKIVYITLNRVRFTVGRKRLKLFSSSFSGFVMPNIVHV